MNTPPHGGDLYRDKVTAAAMVINGFGKSVGLLQVQELGLLETPIALTNTFAVGAVGAGRGMSCFELKGGIGSASRSVRIAGRTSMVGALVLANFGKLPDLLLAGEPLGHRLAQANVVPDSRAELARTGSVYGHGSGDLTLAFSTAYTVAHVPDIPVGAVDNLHHSLLDPFFHATADSVEQAIITALFDATTVTGRDGHVRHALQDMQNAIQPIGKQQ